MASATYDGWKLRSDLDEQLPEQEEQHDECDVCGGLDGDHDRACPERDVIDPIGALREEEARNADF